MLKYSVAIFLIMMLTGVSLAQGADRHATHHSHHHEHHSHHHHHQRSHHHHHSGHH